MLMGDKTMVEAGYGFGDPFAEGFPEAPALGPFLGYETMQRIIQRMEKDARLTQQQMCKARQTTMRFCRYFGGDAEAVLAASAEDVQDFLEKCNVQATTRNAYRTYLGYFFGWAVESGLAAADPTKSVPRYPEQVNCRVYTESDVESFSRMLKELKAMPKDERQVQSYAVFCLHVYCAMSYSEIAEARFDDLKCDPSGWFIDVRGSRSGMVPVAEEARRALGDYLSLRGNCSPGDPLVASVDGRYTPLTPHTVYRRASKIVAAVRPQGLGGLRIRSLLISLALRGGLGEDDVADAHRYKSRKSKVASANRGPFRRKAPQMMMAEMLEKEFKLKKTALTASELREMAGAIGDDECLVFIEVPDGSIDISVRPLAEETARFASLDDLSCGAFGTDIKEAFYRWLGEFRRSPCKEDLLAAEPRWLVADHGPIAPCFLAAAAHRLAIEYDVPIPPWCMKPRYCLKKPVYPPNIVRPELRKYLEESTLLEFRMRGLMFGRNVLWPARDHAAGAAASPSRGEGQEGASPA